MKRMPSSTRILVRSGQVSFYCTVGQVRLGIGTSKAFNASCQKAVDTLEFQQNHYPGVTSVGGTWEGIETQIDVYCLDLEKTP